MLSFHATMMCLRFFSTFLHDLLWNHLSEENDSHRNKYEVINVADDGDKIWNEVDWAENITHD